MWSQSGSNSDELCLIDSGITSMSDLPLYANLRTLNLHCNSLVQIENLHHLPNLRHLDLSSNQISRIQGLEGLVSLRTLNLSCNLITKVDGLDHLRSLVKLNLSYNSIEDLSGFQSVSDGTFKLSHIDLHGNHIASVGHVTRCLVACVNLRSLSLSQNGADNSCCHKPDYRRVVLSGLPQLEVLDGQDRDGRTATQPMILADIPGLDDYLEFLVSDASGTPQKVTLATPKIDAALELFRRHPDSTQEGTTDLESSHGGTWGHNLSLGTTASTFENSGHLSEDHENRIAQLENRLADILDTKSPRKEKSNLVKSVGSPNRSKTKSPRSRRMPSKSDLTDDSESETVTSANVSRLTKLRTPEKFRTPSSSTPASSSAKGKGHVSVHKRSNR